MLIEDLFSSGGDIIGAIFIEAGIGAVEIGKDIRLDIEGAIDNI